MIYMGPQVQGFFACTGTNVYSNTSTFVGQALLGSHVMQNKIALKIVLETS